MNDLINQISPYVRRAKIQSLAQHSRCFIDPDYVWTYILQGNGEFILEGNHCPVEKGDIIFMPPYMMHVLLPNPGNPFIEYIIHFDLFQTPQRQGVIERSESTNFTTFSNDTSNPESLLCKTPYIVSLSLADQQITEQLFRSLKGELAKTNGESNLLSKARMLEILTVYLRQNPKEKVVKKHILKSWRNLEKAINFIQHNYNKPLSVSAISKEAGLSMNYFCSVFKEYTQTSIHQYLNHLRIQQAKNLIETSDMNLTEIADATGFSSIHSFSKLFKKHEGISPSQYSYRQTTTHS